MRAIMIMAAALLLGGCGNSAPPPPPAAPAKLPAGEWEVTAKVTSVGGKVADKARVKVGDLLVSKACVGADGVAPPALFAAKGDSCEAQSPYVRNGRVNVQMSCTREGSGEKVMAAVNGKYTADAITGDGRVTTYVSGMDNHVVEQELTGRRLGECAAGEAKA